MLQTLHHALIFLHCTFSLSSMCIIYLPGNSKYRFLLELEFVSGKVQCEWNTGAYGLGRGILLSGGALGTADFPFFPASGRITWVSILVIMRTCRQYMQRVGVYVCIIRCGMLLCCTWATLIGQVAKWVLPGSVTMTDQLFVLHVHDM